MEKEQILLKIQTLKNQLADSAGLKREESRLTELRTRLEEEMTLLEQEILESHYNPKEIESKKSLVAECQQKMLEIDHLLDDLEEWTDEKVRNTKQELITLILKLHPEQKERYQDLSSRLNFAQATRETLLGISLYLERIINALEKIEIKRMEVKRRGVLSYVFGPNPNVAIGRCLKEACDSSEACLALKPAKENLNNELKDLVTHCKGRWGFRTIDNVFSPAKKRLECHLEEIRNEDNQLLEEIDNLKRQEQEWIERLSSS